MRTVIVTAILALSAAGSILIGAGGASASAAHAPNAHAAHASVVAGPHVYYHA